MSVMNLEGNNQPVPYWHLELAEKSALSAVALDEELCIGASANGVVTLWDLKAGAVIQEFAGSVGPLSLQFERHAVMVGSEASIQLWDGRAGVCHREIAVDGLACMQFNEASIVSGHQGGMLRIWDLRTGNTIHTTDLNNGPVTSICFDEQYLACVCDSPSNSGGSVVAMKMAMGFPLLLHTLKCTSAPTDLSLDSSVFGTVYFGCRDGLVRQWQMPTLTSMTS